MCWIYGEYFKIKDSAVWQGFYCLWRMAMTELETMQRAKMYIDKMANGINPLTDKAVNEDDMINNVRISRCLFYVSTVLDKAIQAETKIERKAKVSKIPFDISNEDLSKYIFSDEPVYVSVISDGVNKLNSRDDTKKLRTQDITDWLINCGLLYRHETEAGAIKKYPTKEGKKMGIVTVEREGKTGTYLSVVYSKEAQKFIIDNMPTIIEFAAQKTTTENAENQWSPWSRQHDECLLDLYSKNVDINEIAVTLKRTTTGVKRRLSKLGVLKK